MSTRLRPAGLLATLLLGACLPAPAEETSGTLLLRQPTVSREHLAFVYGGDIWVADRNGEHPERRTAHASAYGPHFSPDGLWIAYTATYAGNADVYVIPTAGGQPRRLTWHPLRDEVDGWSPDGKRILFASPRAIANNRSNQLYEVPLAGGFEHQVMEAVAWEAAWSPDGTRLAYRPYRTAYELASGWRQYRGGTTTPIWILNPATGAEQQVPHENATDRAPAWAGDEVIFISDRNDGAANLFAYETRGRSLRQLTHETVWDVRAFGISGRSAVYESGGRLKELDLDSGHTRALTITLATEATQLRPQWKDAGKTITAAFLSPTGKRVVVSARGDVFTVPVKDGSIRNLTHTSGVREKDALWSPDGARIAYLTDLGQQHAIVVRDQAGLEKPHVYPLPRGIYFHLLAWSPDGSTLIYEDYHLHLYAFALEKAASALIDTSLDRSPVVVSFSPDSRWLAYTVQGTNHFTRIRVHDFRSGQSADLTDGLSDAGSPVFAPGGDYLYFTASVNSGPSQVGLDLSSQERPLRRGIYVAVLAAGGRSPLLPKAGDEEAGKADADDKGTCKGPGKPDQAADTAADRKEGKAGGKSADKSDARAAERPKPVTIDFEGLQGRISGFPVAERRYESLAVACDGALFYVERRQPGITQEPPDVEPGNDGELYRFDFTERKAKSLKQGIEDVSMSADGKKLLLAYAKGKLEIADANDKLDAKPIDLTQLGMYVDPAAEWQQIFDEAWWMEKDFFYDPNMHGLDWNAVHARYRPLVRFVQRREDLTDLLIEMIGEMQVGHNRLSGGDVPAEPGTKTGLLGADFAVENNHYRIRTIYRGDRWNPFLRAPLAVPGVSVKEGDYLLAVNGRPLDATENLYALFEQTVDRQVTLSVAADSAGTGAHNIVVQPIADEAPLRQWHWIEHNREYVEKKTGGQVAYVYLPNTADDGFRYFNRMFFAQIDKPALIVDERRNSGGQAANYIIEILSRPYLAGWKDRDAQIFSTPGGGIYGPKVMLADQDAGSGGDFLPWAFKHQKLGTLIGTRTWGGLIGIRANPDLIDGAQLTVPFFRFFTPEGEWRVENEGVAPDVEVTLDPAAVNRGADPQLDAAIATVLTQLKDFKPVRLKSAPPYPTSLGK
ncbi:MAG TPA: PDZ domain-containing protein [Steroidobacteraceae bacterium]|nr:PDZ domain-containing protein [Steroidobacteraceae bacterium]